MLASGLVEQLGSLKAVTWEWKVLMSVASMAGMMDK